LENNCLRLLRIAITIPANFDIQQLPDSKAAYAATQNNGSQKI
jgi:hypothetical protein